LAIFYSNVGDLVEDVVKQRFTVITSRPEELQPTKKAYYEALLKHATQYESVEVLKAIIKLSSPPKSSRHKPSAEVEEAKEFLQTITASRDALAKEVNSLRPKAEKEGGQMLDESPSIYIDNPNPALTDPKGKVMEWELYCFSIIALAALRHRYEAVLDASEHMRTHVWVKFKDERKNYVPVYDKLKNLQAKNGAELPDDDDWKALSTIFTAEVS
jgi:hypothetical protein